MVVLYISPSCASCRKARAWLKANRMEFVEKNIFTNRLSYAEVKYLLQRCENGSEDIISTKSNVFRQYGRAIDEMSTNELVNLIIQNPSILKRPIMLSVRSLVVGYDDDEVTAVLPPTMRNMATVSLSNC